MLLFSNRHKSCGFGICAYQDSTPTGQKIRELLMVACVVWLLLVIATAHGEMRHQPFDNVLGFGQESARER